MVGLIVAAGRSERMGGIDKVFLPLLNRPAIAYSWLAFDKCPDISRLVIVCRPECIDRLYEIARSLCVQKPFHLVVGGHRRQDSVWNGLLAISEPDSIVAIHDAARPCLTPELISLTVEAACRYGAAVAASPVVDTIKEADPNGFVARHLDRSKLWAVQTPQTFRYEVIFSAMRVVQESQLLITDDTAACEHIGQKVKLVPWPKPNPKLTYPQDIPYLESVLRELAV